MPTVGGINVDLGRVAASFTAGLRSFSETNKIFFTTAEAYFFSVTGFRRSWAAPLFDDVGNLYLGRALSLKREMALPGVVADVERGAVYYFIAGANEAVVTGDHESGALYYSKAIRTMREVVAIKNDGANHALLADILSKNRGVFTGTKKQAFENLIAEAEARETAWRTANRAGSDQRAEVQLGKLQEVHAKLAVQYLLQARGAIHDNNLPVARGYVEKTARIYGSMADYYAGHKDPHRAVTLFMVQAEGFRRATKLLPDKAPIDDRLGLFENEAAAYEKAALIATNSRKPWLQYRAGMAKVNWAVVRATAIAGFSDKDSVDKALNQAMAFFDSAALDEHFKINRDVLLGKSYELNLALESFRMTGKFTTPTSTRPFLHAMLEDGVFGSNMSILLDERDGRGQLTTELVQNGLERLSEGDRARLIELLRDVGLGRSDMVYVAGFLRDKIPDVSLRRYLGEGQASEIFKDFRGEVDLAAVDRAPSFLKGTTGDTVITGGAREEESFFRKVARRAGR